MADGLNAPRRGGVGAFLLKAAGVIALLAIGALIAAWAVQRYIGYRLMPDPTTIASASLAGLREQNRLSAFAARFVAVTTSRQSQFVFSTDQTLIMPGMVRYEVDLAKLNQRDVAWNGTTRTLSVTLPPVEIDGPQIDLNALRTYGSGGVLSHLTNADATLDAANRSAGQAELLRQARAAPMIALARDATRRAVERSFAMPLQAAGISARISVRFADEAARDAERWDSSRSPAQVMGK